jgi:hypothetical protein
MDRTQILDSIRDRKFFQNHKFFTGRVSRVGGSEENLVGDALVSLSLST